MFYKALFCLFLMSLFLFLVPTPWFSLFLRPDFMLLAFILLALKKPLNPWMGGLCLLSGAFVDQALHLPLGTHSVIYVLAYSVSALLAKEWNRYHEVQQQISVALILFLMQVMLLMLVNSGAPELWWPGIKMGLLVNYIAWMLSQKALSRLLLDRRESSWR